MALLDQEHAYEIADAMIEASEADETEVSIESVEDRFVRFGHEGPTQSADRERFTLAVRVRFRAEDGYREARATAGTIDHQSALGALTRASVLARLSTPRDGALPLGGPVDVEGTSPSRPTQDHSFKEKADWIGAALARCEEASLEGAGLARTTVMSRSLVNSMGRRVHGATSRAEFSVTCADRPGGDGGASAKSSIACFVDQVDVEGVIEDAVRAAVQSRSAQPIDAGPMNVVLEPAAVASLLSMTRECGFGARAYSEGSSFMTGRLGEKLFPENVTLSADPFHADFRGWRFDGEGSARERLDFVANGELVMPVTDSFWAEKLDLKNTGHGVPQPSSYGPSVEHLVMAGGRADRDALLAAAGDGLLVRQLHYVNIVEPQSLVLTGMTRGGTFRIRDGKVAEPVQNLRFTHSLVESLRNVVAIGEAVERSGSLMGGEVVAPAVCIKDFHFTSRSDA